MLHSSPAKGRRPGNYRKLPPRPHPNVLQNTPLSSGEGAVCPSPRTPFGPCCLSPSVEESCPLVGVPPNATTDRLKETHPSVVKRKRGSQISMLDMSKATGMIND